jgi:predicted ATPase
VIHLREISLKTNYTFPNHFPFTVPVIAQLERLVFEHEVTFFVGENGSGKSTLLETIACAAQLPTIGSESVNSDSTLAPQRELANHLQWAWSKRTHRGFFMRSEDFFGFAKRTQQSKHELQTDLEEIRQESKGRSLLAQQLAEMPMKGQMRALQNSYGEGLDVQSHGESYFKLFQARFVPNGIYLLDEPEAPLSPTRQLAFLVQMKHMIEQGAQFIIATHSPILLAYPNATIYAFENGNIQQADYDTLEHVTLTRAFLNDPTTYLRHLLE